MTEERIEEIVRRILAGGAYLRALVTIGALVASYVLASLLVMFGYDLAASDLHLPALSFFGACGITTLAALTFALAYLLKES